MERAALAGTDFNLDVVKERFGDVRTGTFEDASAGIIDRLRDEVISRVQDTMCLAHQDP